MKLKKLLSKQNATTFGAKILVVGLGYFFALYCTNLFGASIYGLFTLGLMILNLSKIFSVFGFDTTLLRFGSEAFANGEMGKLKDVYLKSLIFSGLASLIVACVLFLSSDFIANKMFESPELVFYIKCTALCVLPYSFLSLNAELVKSIGNSALYMVLNEGGHFGIAIVAIQVIAYILESQVVVIGFTISVVILMFYSFLWMELRLNFRKVKREVSFSFNFLIRKASSFVLAYSSAFIKNWSDVILLGMYLTPREVGIYSVVFKISKSVSIPLQAMNSIQAPKFAALFSQKKMKELKTYVKSTSRQIVVLTIPVVLVLLIFPEYTISLFGKEFVGGQMPLFILTFGFLFNSFAGSTALLMKMTGLEKIFLVITVVSLIVGIGLNLWLIPAKGILGAAIASLVVQVLWNGACGIITTRLLGFNTFASLK